MCSNATCLDPKALFTCVIFVAEISETVPNIWLLLNHVHGFSLNVAKNGVSEKYVSSKKRGKRKNVKF